MLSIDAYFDGRHCDNCDKDADVFRVRCDAGTLEADLCAKCLGRQCRMRMKGRTAKDDAAAQQPARGAS